MDSARSSVLVVTLQIIRMFSFYPLTVFFSKFARTKTSHCARVEHGMDPLMRSGMRHLLLLARRMVSAYTLGMVKPQVNVIERE